MQICAATKKLYRYLQYNQTQKALITLLLRRTRTDFLELSQRLNADTSTDCNVNFAVPKIECDSSLPGVSVISICMSSWGKAELWCQHSSRYFIHRYDSEASFLLYEVYSSSDTLSSVSRVICYQCWYSLLSLSIASKANSYKIGRASCRERV